MHFLSIADLTYKEILDLLDLARDLKAMRKLGEFSSELKGKSLAMIFEKPSTRTRVSFEVAMTELGGHALYLDASTLQLGRGETIEDTARVLSRYVHGIMIRAYKHETVRKLAEASTVPVINGLDDLEHPCQILADLMTILEFKGKFKGLKFAWIGDGNNVCNSSILACAITGMEISVACPKGYEPDSAIITKARNLGVKLEIIHSPIDAARNADVLYTDVWVSMGNEAEMEKRKRDFIGYQINKALLEKAKKDAIVLHCLPAHRGEEITSDVVESENSKVFDQAENRLHTQKALLLKLLR
jgi:ornithine carbamoyltransferase